MRTPLALLVAAALALSLVACGGGSSSTTSSQPGSTATEQSAGAESPGSRSGSATFGKPHPRATAKTRAERRAAGRAASFVKPESDNSVPTFGGEASGSQRAEAEANLSAYLAARAAHEWARACTLLAASVRQGFEKIAAGSSKTGAKPSCAQVMPVFAPLKAGAPADPLKGPLLAFRVHGDNAFALFYGPPGHQAYMVPMNREGGAWRPTQAAPIAYPPGAPSGSP